MNARLVVVPALACLMTMAACAADVSDRPVSPSPDTGSIVLQEDQPGWNCQTMGNRVCGSIPACWTEPKTGSGLPAERLCGRADQAPDGSVDFVYYPDGLG